MGILKILQLLTRYSIRVGVDSSETSDDDDERGGGVIGSKVGGGRAISSCLLMICMRTARRDETGDACVRGLGARITDWACSVKCKNQSSAVSADDDGDDDGMIA